jgi:hypothetical protein
MGSDYLRLHQQIVLVALFMSAYVAVAHG